MDCVKGQCPIELSRSLCKSVAFLMVVNSVMLIFGYKWNLFLPFFCLGADKHEVAVNGHVEQVPHRNELSDSQITQAAEESEVVKTKDSSKEKLKLVTAVRSRGARMTKAILVKEKQKATVNSEESSVISAPARGRRGKKPEATAPPIVQRSTRSRNAKSSESSTVEGSVEQSSTRSSKVASKLKGGQKAKKASDDPGEMISKVVAEAEIVPAPESKQTTSVTFREQANENLAAVKKTRERRPKPGQLMPEKEENDGVSHAGKGLILTFYKTICFIFIRTNFD